MGILGIMAVINLTTSSIAIAIINPGGRAALMSIIIITSHPILPIRHGVAIFITIGPVFHSPTAALISISASASDPAERMLELGRGAYILSSAMVRLQSGIIKQIRRTRYVAFPSPADHLADGSLAPKSVTS
jgi:hypothetical protein